MAAKKTSKRPKHRPQRTCIACRQVEGKRALIRLVRTEHGVEVDPSGKLAGRGAYLHPYQSCWKAVLGGNRIDQALRTRLSTENRQSLLAYAANLPDAVEVDEGEPAEDDENSAPTKNSVPVE